jgi:hypothetical protein
MKFRMSLSHKGLILVTVSLICQLALIATLGVVIFVQANSARRAAEDRKQLFENINKIQNSTFFLYDLIESAPKNEQHFLKGDFDRNLLEQTKQITDTFGELRKLAEAHPGQRLYLYRNGSSLIRITAEQAQHWHPGAPPPTPINLAEDPLDLSSVLKERKFENTSEVTDDAKIVTNAADGLNNAIRMLEEIKGR